MLSSVETAKRGKTTAKASEADQTSGDESTSTDSAKVDFEAYLKGILGGSEVSEEELFAALIQERIAETKGEAAATKFAEVLAEKKQSLAASGNTSFEAAAREALKAFQGSGELTAEEADKLHSEAFAAAQLDDQAEYLYDGTGGDNDPTKAVASLESALAKAKEMLANLGAGTATLTSRPLADMALGSEKFAHVALGFASGVGIGAAAPSGTGESSGGFAFSAQAAQVAFGGKIDGAQGFLFKPISDTQGKLVILTPAGMTGDIKNLVLKDEKGEVIESSPSSGKVGNGGREHFRFNRPGSSYPTSITVEAQMKDGSVKTWQIADSSKRWD